MNALIPFRSNRRSNQNSAATGDRRGQILREIHGIFEKNARIDRHSYANVINRLELKW